MNDVSYANWRTTPYDEREHRLRTRLIFIGVVGFFLLATGVFLDLGSSYWLISFVAVVLLVVSFFAWAQKHKTPWSHEDALLQIFTSESATDKWPGYVVIYQREVLTGADLGVMTFEGAKMRFQGLQSDFLIDAADMEPLPHKLYDAGDAFQGFEIIGTPFQIGIRPKSLPGAEDHWNPTALIESRKRLKSRESQPTLLPPLEIQPSRKVTRESLAVFAAPTCMLLTAGISQGLRHHTWSMALSFTALLVTGAGPFVARWQTYKRQSRLANI